MNSLRKPYTLADLAEEWVRHLPRLSLVGSLATVLGLLPSVLISARLLPQLRSWFLVVGEWPLGEAMDPQMAWKVLSHLVPFLGMVFWVSLFAVLGRFYSELVIQNDLNRIGQEEPLPVPRSLVAVFPRVVGYGLIASVLAAVIVAATFLVFWLVAALVLVLGGIVLTPFAGPFGVGILAVLLTLLFLVGAVALDNLLALYQPAVVDGHRPWDAIQKSLQLGGRFFWRLLGLRVLLSLALGTLLGVVLFLPLTLLVATNAWEWTQLDQFTVAGRLRPEDWKRFFDLLEPLLGALVLSFLLSSLASNLAYPPLQLLVYHDLSARLEGSTALPTEDAGGIPPPTDGSIL